MLPPELHGPGLTIAYASDEAAAFLRANVERYPHLDRDFILEICFEHPDRFDELFPRFDVEKHTVVRVLRTARWINDNVRYDCGEVVDFWCGRFQQLLMRNDHADEVFERMQATGTWHFPPVIIEADFAFGLGAPADVGQPYHLVEGTHRLSYLRSMVQCGLVDESRHLPIIEVVRR